MPLACRGFLGVPGPLASSESPWLPWKRGAWDFPVAGSKSRYLWLSAASSESLSLPCLPLGETPPCPPVRATYDTSPAASRPAPATGGAPSPWLARSPGTFGFLRLPRSQGRYLPCLLLQGALPLPRELSPRPQPPMIAPAGAIAQTPAADDSSKSRYLWLSVASSLASL